MQVTIDLDETLWQAIVEEGSALRLNGFENCVRLIELGLATSGAGAVRLLGNRPTRERIITQLRQAHEAYEFFIMEDTAAHTTIFMRGLR